MEPYLLSCMNTGRIFLGAERGRREVPLSRSNHQSQWDRKSLTATKAKQEVPPPKSCTERATRLAHTCVAARTVLGPPPGGMPVAGWALIGLGFSSGTLRGRGCGVCTGVKLCTFFSGWGTTGVHVPGCFFFLCASLRERHRQQMHRRRRAARSARPSRDPRTMPAMAPGPRVGPTR